MDSTVKSDQILKAAAPLIKKWSSIPTETLRAVGLNESNCFSPGQKYMDFIQYVKGGNDANTEWKKYTLARLLENAYNEQVSRRRLSESTMTHAVGAYEKFVFPTIVAVYANLLVDKWVSVQPLTAPSGLIFYMDIVAGSQKGNIAKGSKLYTATLGPVPNSNYSSETIEEENSATGDGSTTAFQFNLSYLPIRPGTVNITAQTAAGTTMTVNDDGSGNLVGNTGAASTVNYQTGAINVTFSSAPASGVLALSTYEYLSESNSNLPQLDFRLTSTTVQAQTFKLNTNWSVEAQMDLQQLHGMSLDKIILDYTNNEIQREIQNKIIGQLLTIASAGTLTWSRTPPTGVQYYFHKQQVRDVMSQAKAAIRTSTRRFTPNWIICDPQFAAIVRTVEGFTAKPPPSNVAGIFNIGTIDGMEIYENPDMLVLNYAARPANSVGLALVGYKGQNFIEAGYVFAPYLGVYTTDTYTLEDMVSRRGIMYRAGMKPIEAAQYAVINLTSTPNQPESVA